MKVPLVLVLVLKVKVYGEVPPVAVMVTVPDCPVHGMGVVTEVPAVISVGWVIPSVPDLVHPWASITLHA